MALDNPFPLKEGKDPTQCLTRMVGKNRKKDNKRTLKFMSQVTVDLDNPPVWRFRAEYDEFDLDIPLKHWDDEMIEIAVDELYLIFPEWDARERTYKDVGSTFVEWRSPLTQDELLQMGVPIFDPSPADHQ
tara:strand:+ start:200 stop:592 length:393 start_codon:yes stop_codon:yes gene_type:complete